MKLFNTKSRSIEILVPLHSPKVTFYSCGPTVYDYTHFGHLRTYTNNDVLRKALQYIGLNVDHVMNITDVGHLSDDADAGEDKLEKGAKKFGKTVEEVAEFFTQYFLSSIDAMHIARPNKLAKATDHIQDMISLIKILEEKGYTYDTPEALYFDTSKDSQYGELSGQSLADKKQARDDVYVDKNKKNSTDFVLWFKRVGKFENHSMHWDSPWGDGFPGWHIECSAMSMKYLGHTIDIHSGGIDHIPVHHENEIAQSECATGEQFVKIWFHNVFLLINGEKMSKSLGNLLTIDDVKEKNIDPLALRYLFLQTHYRQSMNFTWDALAAAQTALIKLRRYIQQFQVNIQRTSLSEEKLNKVDSFQNAFKSALENDLQMPQALAVVWEVAKSNIPSTDKVDLLRSFDEVLSLDLFAEEDEGNIPKEITKLAQERIEARNNKDFALADQIRNVITQKGYSIKDTSDGFILRKN